MAYYYHKNNKGDLNKPYYRNKVNQFKSNIPSYILENDKSLDSLIIDENTVYEIDEECMKRLLASNKHKKNNHNRDS